MNKGQKIWDKLKNGTDYLIWGLLGLCTWTYWLFEVLQSAM